MTVETPLANWLEEEEKNLGSGTPSFEKLPTLKFEQNKIIEFDVDFSVPFPKWNGKAGDKEVTKAIIPTIDKRDGIKKNLWLNLKNVLYSEIIRRGRKGQKTFKVIMTGSQSDTRYNLVD